MQKQPITFTETGKATRRERLYFLDWLRVFAILAVFFIHCGKFFDYHTTVVFNTVQSPVLSAFRDFTLVESHKVIPGQSLIKSYRSSRRTASSHARLLA
jgi:peptidoglycan/LPS O-acetylase OafA/YrhL